jgi:hypothetical protein
MLNRVAELCHTAHKLFCEAHDDFTQLSWVIAPDWQRDSAVKGVEYVLNNYPNLRQEAQHEQWMLEKVRTGWIYGPIKDADMKTHPCIVPYDQLPKFQQDKDALFQQSAVMMLKIFGLLTDTFKS